MTSPSKSLFGGRSARELYVVSSGMRATPSAALEAAQRAIDFEDVRYSLWFNAGTRGWQAWSSENRDPDASFERSRAECLRRFPDAIFAVVRSTNRREVVATPWSTS